MYILTGRIKTELVVKNSRFIAELIPIDSQKEAREVLHKTKETFSDSSHVVHAFIAGTSGEVMGMSDDGEPSGTAGRPVMDVLKGRGITNCILLVIRYFGGTLLGTGGLVKAYGDAAKQVLDKAKVENILEEYVEKTEFSFSCSYPLYEKIKRYMDTLHVSQIKEQFLGVIEITGLIYSSEKKALSTMLKEISNGVITVK